MLGPMIGVMLFVPPVAPAVAATVAAPLTEALPTPEGMPDDGQEIVVSSRHRPAPGDPLERVNALSFSLTQHLDDAVTGPAAHAYTRVVPKPVRLGFRNFFSNLREPVVFANYLLQLKFGKATETVGRFAINTTIGLGGTIDVAKRCPFGLPLRQNLFSDTLGFYGVKPGPFLYVPVAGPTTVRDLVGGAVDFFASPFTLGGPFRSRPYVIGSAAVRILDRRDQKEEMVQTVRDSDDPYAARRDLYLQRQQERVDGLHGGGASPPHRCRRKVPDTDRGTAS